MQQEMLWTVVTPTPLRPSSPSRWPAAGVQKASVKKLTRNYSYYVQKATTKTIESHRKTHKQKHIASIYTHLYLVVLQHFEKLFMALLRDEDALSGSDTATTGQTVIQCDLCFL